MRATWVAGGLLLACACSGQPASRAAVAEPGADAGVALSADAAVPVLVPCPEVAMDAGASGAPPVVPATTDEEDIQRLELEMLAPTPFNPCTAARVRKRLQPPDGVRERVEDLVVTSRCAEDSCFDGLRDLRTGRELIPTEPTAGEREVLAAPGYLQRVVRIATVSERYVSLYLGDSSYSGGAHANNGLVCATYDRRTGRPLKLSQVVPAAEARALTRKASRMLTAFLSRHAEVEHTLRPASFLYDAATRRISLCAEGDMPVAGSALLITPPR